MRIITGTAKGTKLAAPKGLRVRPTGDRVKESVFNILGNRVIDANVLDLFAGTGNLGLEALSRGAHSATFVDNHMESILSIQRNAQLTHLADRVHIVRADVYKALETKLTGQRFNLIFCDPPYNLGHAQAVMDQLDQLSALQENGLAIIEHSRHEMITGSWENLSIIRTQRFGETIVTIVQQIAGIGG